MTNSGEFLSSRLHLSHLRPLFVDIGAQTAKRPPTEVADLEQWLKIVLADTKFKRASAQLSEGLLHEDLAVKEWTGMQAATGGQNYGMRKSFRGFVTDSSPESLASAPSATEPLASAPEPSASAPELLASASESPAPVLAAIAESTTTMAQPSQHTTKSADVDLGVDLSDLRPELAQRNPILFWLVLGLFVTCGSWLVYVFTCGGGYRELIFDKGVTKDVVVECCEDAYGCARCCFSLRFRTHLIILAVIVFTVGGFALLWHLGIMQPVADEMVCYLFIIICLCLVASVIFCELRHVVLQDFKPIADKVDAWVTSAMKAAEEAEEALDEGIDWLEDMTGIDLPEPNEEDDEDTKKKKSEAKGAAMATAKAKARARAKAKANKKLGCC